MVSSETGQQGVRVGQEVYLSLYPLVFYPAGEPLDPALLLGPVGHLSGNREQIGALLPTIPLMSMASVFKCRALLPLGSVG